MYIDQNSMLALQILPQANTTSDSRHSKTSLLELLTSKGSELGKKRLQQWLLRPLCNIDLITARHNTIKMLLGPENIEHVGVITPLLTKMANIRRSILNLEAGKANFMEWLKLNDFLRYSLTIYHNVMKFNCYDDDVTIIEEIMESFEPEEISLLINSLNNTLDFEVSKELKKPTVLDGVDSSLDEYRRCYNELEKTLEQLASNLRKKLLDQLSLSVAYIPQLGYLILIELRHMNELQNFGSLSEWEEVFRTSTTVYHKNEDMREMDYHYGDTYSLMCDCEIEIIQNLGDLILSRLQMLLTCLDLFATLDCYLILARTALDLNYVQPQMVEEPILEIDSSRHPLYEFLVDTFVPNDIKLGEINNKRIAVVSGANLSGKSVYLTQVGLIVFLAQIGSFVPASRARIGICDKILTRIFSRESLSKQKSTFVTDVQQAEKCLRLMTPRSLVLIDEFGKGTDINDGPALFASVLKNLSSMSLECPRTVAVTHFHEIFTDNKISEYLKLENLFHFNMEVIMNKDDDSNSITYLFQLKEGLTKSSFGIHCAKICGIDEAVIDRAKIFLSLLQKGEDVISFCNQLSEHEARNLETLEDIIRKFIMWDFDNEPNEEHHSVRQKLDEMLFIRGNTN